MALGGIINDYTASGGVINDYMASGGVINYYTVLGVKLYVDVHSHTGR